MQNTVKKVILDYEWISLMKTAKTMGMTTDEVREYLKEAGGEKKK